MSPQAGCGYLATAAHFAAESSTSSNPNLNPNVCTSDDSAKSADALVYYINPGKEEMKIAYPCLLLGRNIKDGRAMRSSLSMLHIGNHRGLGCVKEGVVVGI